MNSEHLIALILFSIPLAITPGPNNILLANSAAQFGFKRTIPHIVGVELGFVFLILLCAMGLGSLYEQLPALPVILKGFGVVYLGYLAFSLFRSLVKIGEGEVKENPIRFWEAFAFQFVNPKALVIVSSLLGGFATPGEGYYESVAYILLMVMVVGLPCISIWALFGTTMKKLMRNEVQQKIFNASMGCLTLVSIKFLI